MEVLGYKFNLFWFSILALSLSAVELSRAEVPTESLLANEDTYHFNLKNNSFKNLHFTGVKEPDRGLDKAFNSIDFAGNSDFKDSLIASAHSYDLNPCYAISIALINLNFWQGKSREYISLLADSPDKSYQRAIMAGVAVNSYADVNAPGTSARILVQYLSMLFEIFEGQGNMVALSYWSSFDAVKNILDGREEFSYDDLDNLKASTRLYNECVSASNSQSKIDSD